MKKLDEVGKLKIKKENGKKITGWILNETWPFRYGI